MTETLVSNSFENYKKKKLVSQLPDNNNFKNIIVLYIHDFKVQKAR